MLRISQLSVLEDLADRLGFGRRDVYTPDILRKDAFRQMELVSCPSVAAMRALKLTTLRTCKNLTGAPPITTPSGTSLDRRSLPSSH